MKIFMIPIGMVHEDYGEDLNGFLPSDWNEMRELPKEVLTYLQYCKDHDLVYNPYNFMLDFNLEDGQTNSEDYLMFIPDDKFKI